jgi:hypothetical protein
MKRYLQVEFASRGPDEARNRPEWLAILLPLGALSSIDLGDRGALLTGFAGKPCEKNVVALTLTA